MATNLKKRTPNFSEYEKELLRTLIQARPVILDKSTKSAINERKKKAWEEVMLAFNSHNQTRSNTEAEKLKYLFKNMRTKATNEHKRGTMKTVGGTSEKAELSRLLQQLSAIEPSLNPMHTNHESENGTFGTEGPQGENEIDITLDFLPEKKDDLGTVYHLEVDTSPLNSSKTNGSSNKPPTPANIKERYDSEKEKIKAIDSEQEAKVRMELYEIKKQCSKRELELVRKKDEYYELLIKKTKLEIEFMENDKQKSF